MSEGIITWNNVRSDTLGIKVEKYPNYTKPKRKMDVYNIPGRNGDIVMMQDAWENVEQKYDIWVGDDTDHSIHDIFTAIANWLYTPVGYKNLADDFDPDHFRLAYLEGPVDIESLSIGRAGKATLTFICKPQRFLVSGNVNIIISASDNIRNPTNFPSKPLVYVSRSAAGSGTVSIGNTTLTISELPANGLYIDCDECRCYDESKNNMNSYVSSSTGQFPVMASGNNSISFTGNISYISVAPRWFDI